MDTQTFRPDALPATSMLKFPKERGGIKKLTTDKLKRKIIRIKDSEKRKGTARGDEATEQSLLRPAYYYTLIWVLIIRIKLG